MAWDEANEYVNKMVAQNLCMYKLLKLIGQSCSHILGTYMHTSMHRTGNETNIIRQLSFTSIMVYT